MSNRAEIERGRQAYDRRQWDTAYAALTRADAQSSLAPDDLERLAWAAALSGRDDAFLSALERLYEALVEAGEPQRAARMAFWLGFRCLSLGELGRGSGWLQRAERLLEVEAEECAETGYLLLPAAHAKRMVGDLEGARQLAARAAATGERFGDADLTSFARAVEGNALARQGHIRKGMALLDEAMVAVSTGEVSPLMAGLVYCTVIESCHRVFALDRAREWTRALTDWCAEQPELVTFTGRCLVHRSEALQLGGEWGQAVDEARRVCERFADALDPEAVGEGHYQQAEIHRLRGERAEAERAYAEASRFGSEPHPGLALLRLQEGRVDAASAAIRRVLGAENDPLQRARFLPAQVEIALEAGEIEAARAACEELRGIASSFETEVLGAIADRAQGALALAEGAPEVAVEPLRRAFRVWQQMGAPYLAARVRVLLARAFRALGDEDGARFEQEAARNVFQELDASCDLARLPRGAKSAPARNAHGLTPRQLEVLRLVARGSTNKQIAGELYISEKTVDRHVSNIFLTVGVSTRAAATAFAYENGLV